VKILEASVVLVVEDDGFQRRTIARMLRSMGVGEVREAADGKEALASLRDGAIGLVICDLDMPEMDGMELIRHLGETYSAVPVIIASAQKHALLASVEKMAHAYGVRLLGTIEKPVTRAGLDDLIAAGGAATAPIATTSAGAPDFSLEQIDRGLRENQFEPFFQAKASLATGEILGAEALARWRHPELGVIGPQAFIATLERSGNIDALTLVMLERAARACAGWRQRGMPMTVSVNLSLVSMADIMLADRVTAIVRGAGLESRFMILEITESSAMTEVAPALENLARLRMRGFGLSVDDYGTGFSSLQQLTRVPFTELKIDQGFVTGCAANAAARAIVESSVNLARQLDLKSVAEGVETQADWDVLRSAGCDLAQGYFIARPKQESAFMTFCRAESMRRAAAPTTPGGD